MSDLKARLAAASRVVRRNAANVALEASVNVLLPFAVFNLASARIGQVDALIAASAPPLTWSIVEFIRKRKIDAVSMLVLTGIVFSLLAFFGGGGFKALQLREKLVTGLIGLLFLGSVAIGRPLIYVLAKATISRTSAVRAAAFASLKDDRPFRGAILLMTLVWGFGLVGDCAASVVLTYVLTPAELLIAGPILGYGAIGLMTAWTVWYARRRIGPAIVAAEAAQTAVQADGGQA
jgi:hypothetical protein